MDSLCVLAMNAVSIKYEQGWYLILVECKVLTIKEKGFEWMDGWLVGLGYRESVLWMNSLAFSNQSLAKIQLPITKVRI